VRNEQSPRPKPIPGPKARFFLSHLRKARAAPLDCVLELTRTYGDVSQVWLGPNRLIIINHPDAIKHVLLDHSANYGRPAFVALLRRVVGNGLLFSEGDFWLRQRRTMQPMFHRERIAGFAKIMGQFVAARVSAWRERDSAAQAPLDLSQEMARLTFEIVGRALFSTDLASESSALGAAIQLTLKWLDVRTASPLSAPLFIPTADNRRFRAAQRLFATTISRMATERRERDPNAEQPGDLLAMLLAARDPETGHGMSDKQLHDELLTFLIAGYETTSAALEWTLILLARHPDVAERVRREQHAICGARPPAVDDLPRMPYTRMVLDEALRLYPPVFGLSRRVLQPDVIAGYEIPKGAQLLVSPYAMHRHPKLWEHPDRFYPEHFEAERVKQRPRFAYFPFGGGPRQCIGNAFAMLELQVLVPTILGAFEIELAEGADAAPQARMTLRPRGPVLMRVRAVSADATQRLASSE
jgi:cytochrome P450